MFGLVPKLIIIILLVSKTMMICKIPKQMIAKIGNPLLSNDNVLDLPVSWLCTYLYPRYEVYRGYIVFTFSVIMFVCLFVSVNIFFVKDFSATTWVRILKFGTKLDSDELYCVTNEQPHIAYQSLYLFIFLSLQ